MAGMADKAGRHGRTLWPAWPNTLADFTYYVTNDFIDDFSKIASEAPIASEATQSAVKKVLSLLGVPEINEK
ncbi:hypothetical protein BpHYR1_009811 [Brachionus plicatilis]|uniref:Uncharacterized protein n=1 Tax=Brachionus plicatilis TaxID=10195 RepID=A0A3M7RX16_BRAPC|nr:hypothetical protein BpHYR1_009811 [Brachionus plicatilis]